MLPVELIFDAACPHVAAARVALRTALQHAGRPLIWTEWDRGASNAPVYAQRYASPTILVAGHDVAGACALDAGSGCRVYAAADGTFTGAPSAETILTALMAAQYG
jgi:hypothetical protein